MPTSIVLKLRNRIVLTINSAGTINSSTARYAAGLVWKPVG